MKIPKSRSKSRIMIRNISGNATIHLTRRKNGKPTCPSGRPLPGTARGTPVEVVGMRRTERRPSRPFGGVLSSPAMRDVMKQRAKDQFSAPEKQGEIFGVGSVCMKIAGRDAGKMCVVTEVMDKGFVKVDGYTRPRKVNTNHLEPTGKTVSIKKGAASEDIQAMLA